MVWGPGEPESEASTQRPRLKPQCHREAIRARTPHTKENWQEDVTVSGQLPGNLGPEDQMLQTKETRSHLRPTRRGMTVHFPPTTGSQPQLQIGLNQMCRKGLPRQAHMDTATESGPPNTRIPWSVTYSRGLSTQELRPTS